MKYAYFNFSQPSGVIYAGTKMTTVAVNAHMINNTTADLIIVSCHAIAAKDSAVKGTFIASAACYAGSIVFNTMALLSPLIFINNKGIFLRAIGKGLETAGYNLQKKAYKCA